MSVIRPTIATVQARLEPILDHVYNVPKCTNKGKPGLHLEELLKIPHSPACLDCEDGEIKAFPLKRLANDTLAPKETVAVTMVQKEALLETPWKESRVFAKLKNTLFIGYIRDGDNITYKLAILFNESHPLMEALAEDYRTIQESAAAGVMSGSIGKLLQTRTKGPGHGSTSRAFYLRTKFLSDIM
jgi:hypothetical protein